jgi:DNA-binding MarR family transcriptional regulator
VPGSSAPEAPADPCWLDDEQQASWRAFNGMIHELRFVLECQLQRDAGLSFIEYHALARLSENPGRVMRMSELAEVTNASLSRLSHLIKRLEARDLVRREPDPTDGRYTNAILTETGLRLLVASAPAHVAKVRELVIDALSPDELRSLRTVSERILQRVKTGTGAGNLFSERLTPDHLSAAPMPSSSATSPPGAGHAGSAVRCSA